MAIFIYFIVNENFDESQIKKIIILLQI